MATAVTTDEIYERYLRKAITEINRLSHEIAQAADGAPTALPTGHPLANIFLLKYGAQAQELQAILDRSQSPEARGVAMTVYRGQEATWSSATQDQRVRELAHQHSLEPDLAMTPELAAERSEAEHGEAER